MTAVLVAFYRLSDHLQCSVETYVWVIRDLDLWVFGLARPELVEDVP